MIRKIVLPALAVFGVIFALYTVVSGSRPSPIAAPAAEPSHAPFSNYVAGAGIVEALSENIQVGTIVPGVVKEIYVKVGDNVKKDQPLWLIDDRDLRADLTIKQSAVAVQQSLLTSAQSKYDRLKQMPRPEEVPPAEARVQADFHSLEDARDQLKIVQSVNDPRAVSKDDLDKRRHAVDIAQAHLAESQANLTLLKAGSWDQDLKVAEADIQSAQANLEAAKMQVQSDMTLIDRLTVRSPVDGQVLQVKIHLGERSEE